MYLLLNLEPQYVIALEQAELICIQVKSRFLKKFFIFEKILLTHTIYQLYDIIFFKFSERDNFLNSA